MNHTSAVLIMFCQRQKGYVKVDIMSLPFNCLSDQRIFVFVFGNF